MGILGNSVSVTRFNAAGPAEGPDFEAISFRAIEPGSEVRERMGVVPFELDSPYEVAQGRYAFRVRIDRRRPDPTAVRERLRELIKTEIETTGAPFVGPKKRKQLKELAESELVSREAPRSKIVECVLDGGLLYVASTAKTVLGTVLTLLRQAEVAADYKAPWLDEAPEVDEMSDIVVPKEPGQSVLGCRFLKLLLEDQEVMVEPEAGSVRLATREAKVNLTGGVLAELFRYVEEGAEILSAKLFIGQVPLRFDALSWRLNGLKLEALKNEHWTMDLDQRLEQLAGVYDLLDAKYAALKHRLGEVGAVPVPAQIDQVDQVDQVETAPPVSPAPESEAVPA
ncbi:MAG TPA: hypothetical protein VEG34_01255 [Thermoanaerobaculia bacterium]|nr:hypothetical protein [Thermoanaerobaculia bacterium]